MEADAWTKEEDQELTRLVRQFGARKWRLVASHMKLAPRNAAQCRERWFTTLRPDKKLPWTPEEDQKMLDLVNQYGHRWAFISTLMSERSENAIKNRYHTFFRTFHQYNPQINIGRTYPQAAPTQNPTPQSDNNKNNDNGNSHSNSSSDNNCHQNLANNFDHDDAIDIPHTTDCTSKFTSSEVSAPKSRSGASVEVSSSSLRHAGSLPGDGCCASEHISSPLGPPKSRPRLPSIHRTPTHAENGHSSSTTDNSNNYNNSSKNEMDHPPSNAGRLSTSSLPPPEKSDHRLRSPMHCHDTAAPKMSDLSFRHQVPAKPQFRVKPPCPTKLPSLSCEDGAFKPTPASTTPPPPAKITPTRTTKSAIESFLSGQPPLVCGTSSSSSSSCPGADALTTTSTPPTPQPTFAPTPPPLPHRFDRTATSTMELDLADGARRIMVVHPCAGADSMHMQEEEEQDFQQQRHHNRQQQQQQRSPSSGSNSCLLQSARHTDTDLDEPSHIAATTTTSTNTTSNGSCVVVLGDRALQHPQIITDTPTTRQDSHRAPHPQKGTLPSLSSHNDIQSPTPPRLQLDNSTNDDQIAASQPRVPAAGCFQAMPDEKVFHQIFQLLSSRIHNTAASTEQRSPRSNKRHYSDGPGAEVPADSDECNNNNSSNKNNNCGRHHKRHHGSKHRRRGDSHHPKHSAPASNLPTMEELLARVQENVFGEDLAAVPVRPAVGQKDSSVSFEEDLCWVRLHLALQHKKDVLVD